MWAYKDLKLHAGRWPWLQPLAHLLSQLSFALGASEYLDFYQRDLGAFHSLAHQPMQPSLGEFQEVLNPWAGVKNTLAKLQ